MISGVIVTMALIIIQILQQLNLQTSNLGSTVGDLGNIFGQITITPFEFIMVVGIYLIESSFILSFFTNEIESGDDDTGLKKTAGNALITGYLVFVLIFAATYVLFGPLINQVV